MHALDIGHADFWETQTKKEKILICTSTRAFLCHVRNILNRQSPSLNFDENLAPVVPVPTGASRGKC